MPDYRLTSIQAEGLQGITVVSPLVHHESSSKLLAILPGRGYTGDSPALHYLRKVALGLGYDVLTVVYSFQYAPGVIQFSGQNWRDLMPEVDQAIRKGLERGYGKLTLVGKSLGTPLAAEWAQRSPVPETDLILMTPVYDSAKNAGSVRTLAVIGTYDAFYDAKAIAEDSARPNLKWHVMEGLNHGLEYEEDWAGSLRALREIMAVCEAFLKRVEWRRDEMFL